MRAFSTKEKNITEALQKQILTGMKSQLVWEKHQKGDVSGRLIQAATVILLIYPI